MQKNRVMGMDGFTVGNIRYKAMKINNFLKYFTSGPIFFEKTLFHIPSFY
jgi:hypothetical protein